MNNPVFQQFPACNKRLLSTIYVSLLICGNAWSADSLSCDAAAAVYPFRQSIGSKSDTVFRSIATEANHVVITFEEPPHLSTRAVCDTLLHIQSWHYEDRETGYDVEATRSDDIIRITGAMRKKSIRKTIEIDSLPWYQAMEFSLLSFLKGAALSCGFWIIRPSDMQAFHMIARRKAVETIKVNGRQEPTVKVTLSPCGILGNFWHATYWYRALDFKLLKSEIPRGPGASPMIIESIETKRPQ